MECYESRGRYRALRAFASAFLILSSCGRIGFDKGLASGDANDELPGGDGGAADGGSSDGTTGVDAMVPLNGLVSWWDFDDGVGQIVSAAVGTNGTLGTSPAIEASDPTWDTTPNRICSGAGLRFDGNSDVVSVPGPSTANLSSFTVAFSMYPTGSGQNGLPRILTKEDGGLADLIVHYRAADNAVAINIFNTSGELFATFAGGAVFNERANWAVTFDDAGDQRVRVYQNGNEASYTRQDQLLGSLRTTTQSWQIGNQNTQIRTFDGTLDAIRIYDRVLRSDEIAALSSICPPS